LSLWNTEAFGVGLTWHWYALVTICHDLSRFVTICHDLSRFVTLGYALSCLFTPCHSLHPLGQALEKDITPLTACLRNMSRQYAMAGELGSDYKSGWHT